MKNLKKRYQEKWENAHLTLKNARASRALRLALDPGQCVCSLSSHSGQYICKLIFSLQQKKTFIFSKIIRIFCHGSIQFLLCAYINYWLKNLKKRYQEKWENSYLTAKNARASQLIFARFARSPVLRAGSNFLK